MKKTYGLIGFPLSHSYSKDYFTEKFREENLGNCEYLNFELESLAGIRELVEKHSSLCGLNVTIPYKIEILPYLDKTDENVRLIGSVNTIKIERFGKEIILLGYNTDHIGFMMALKPLLRTQHNRALILGNGGSSRAVQHVLKNLGISCLVVTRKTGAKDTLTYADLNENHIRFHSLIINTTPVGMFPNIEDAPEIPYGGITSEHLLFDLVYNPELTEFLKRGKENGAMISNGITMLHQQAIAAWKIWNS